MFAPTLRRVPMLAALCLLALPGSASAAGLTDQRAQWLPSSPGASWTYEWSNSAYTSSRQRETYTVLSNSGPRFRLGWEGEADPDSPDAPPSKGSMDFLRTDAGLTNTSWASTPPPSDYPVLCASAAECGNSVAGALYLAIWGTRSPVLAEPLYAGTRWGSAGGAQNDVRSDNRYLGREKVVVPAFPAGVTAAKVVSTVTQAGALGDPFGSGVRTVHWVHGVGPVKIVMRHASGEFSEAVLTRTTLAPRRAPSDAGHLALNRGDRFDLRWRNSRHMRRWSTQRFDVGDVVNGTAQVTVKHRSGPIRVAGGYLFSTRLGGITNISASVTGATQSPLPRLGPKSDRRYFFTPLDLLVFGINPVLPAHPVAKQTWKTDPAGRDRQIYGADVTSVVTGTARVKTPAGTFKALAVRATIKQAGSRFGSGVRTSYFAPGRGLVKLVFRHRDGSVSTAERVKVPGR